MRFRSLFLLFSVGYAAIAQSTVQTDIPEGANQQVNRIFAEFDHTSTPGCAVGVSIRGNDVFRAAYGMSDLEHHIALTPDSIFEAGSISKQFTAAAILLLVKQGKLSLSDPINKYFPELPTYGASITIDHLVHHTSGLRDWGSIEAVAGWPRSTRVYSNAGVLDIATHQQSLNYKPGEDWSYTNTGYNLLAILVQRVTGNSLAVFTHDALFVSLGMKTTTWRDDFQRIVEERAIAYEKFAGGQRQLMPFENAYGNGGLLTTVGDLLHWNDRFVSHQVFDTDLVKRELELGKLNDDRSTFYAAGLFITTRHGETEISHSGSTAGYSTWLGYYPNKQLSVAVLCNEADVNATLLGHKVVDVYDPAPSTDDMKNGHVTPTVLAPGLEGLYLSRRSHVIFSIERTDDKLVASGNTPIMALTPMSFRLSPEGTTYQLVTDEGGRVAGMRTIFMDHPTDIFDKVEPHAPSKAELQAMTGIYMSDEAEATIKVILTPKGLEIHQRPDKVYLLKPTYKNAFLCELGSLRFLLNKDGGVKGISLSDSRMWDLRLKKVADK